MKGKIVLLFILGIYLMGCTNLSSKQEKRNYSSLSEFIELIESEKVKKREKIVENEMENIIENYKTPEIVGNEVLFFYRDKNAMTVNLIGDLNVWSGSGYKMENIEGTSIFYLKKELEENARIQYKFIVNGKKEALDSLNPLKHTSVFGTDSVFEMPGYNYVETKYHENIAHGEIVVKKIKNNTIFGSKDQKRKIQIYLPPNYSEDKQYKTLYFCDGSDYVNGSKIPNVLDYMIDKGEIEPVVAVFVDWLERNKEYIEGTKDKYLEFLTDELIPMMEAEYSLISDREGRVAVGPSNGGYFVTYVGAVATDKFKYIFNQSGFPDFGAYGKVEFGMKYERDNLPLRVFSVAGKYERKYNQLGAERFHDYLKNNPSILGEKYVLYPQGHTYRMWGDSFREGILWLLYNKEI